MKNAKRKGTQVDCDLTKISCMKQSMAAVYATGFQQRSCDTHVTGKSLLEPAFLCYPVSLFSENSVLTRCKYIGKRGLLPCNKEFFI